MAHLPRIVPETGDVSYYDENGLTLASRAPINYREADGDTQEVAAATPLPISAGSGLMDGMTTALRQVSYEHHEIHGGSTFCVHLADTAVAKNTEMGALFTTPDSDKWCHLVYQIDMADKATFDILEGPTIDTGNYPTTFYEPRNRNRNSTNESVVSSVRGTPVANQVSLINDGDTTPVSADGTVLHTEIIGGAKKGKTASDGHSHSDEYILKANTTYYFRVVGDNTGEGSLQFSMELIWYEHTNPS